MRLGSLSPPPPLLTPRARPGKLEGLTLLRSLLMTLAAASLVAAVAAAPAARQPRARKVLAPTGFPGWQTHNVTSPVVVRDAARGLWRMYYTGSATDQVSDSAWDLHVTGVATSRDLARWSRPDDYEPVLIGARLLEGDVVDLGVTGPPRFDAIVASVTSVTRDAGQWRAWYTGWNGDERPLGGGRVEPVHFRIGEATSPDGLRWTKRDGPGAGGSAVDLGGEGAIDSMSASHPAVLHIGGTYHLWYEAYDGRAWRIAHAESTDGRAWRKTGAALEPGEAGALDALGARHPTVRPAAEGYELWYQGRSRAAPAFHVLRARSADGRAWTKVAGEVTLHPDPPLAGDERVHAGSVIARPDGTLLVFFAKETAALREGPWGPVKERRTAIFSEAVKP
jgi:hypothetical protein